MVATLVKNADRMMCSTALLDAGIRADFCRRLRGVNSVRRVARRHRRRRGAPTGIA